MSVVLFKSVQVKFSAATCRHIYRPGLWRIDGRAFMCLSVIQSKSLGTESLRLGFTLTRLVQLANCAAQFNCYLSVLFFWEISPREARAHTQLRFDALPGKSVIHDSLARGSIIGSAARRQ